MSPAQRRAAERRWQDWAFRRGPHPYGPEFDAVTEAIEVAAGEVSRDSRPPTPSEAARDALVVQPVTPVWTEEEA